MSGTRRAIDLLKSFVGSDSDDLNKAQSAGRSTNPSEKQEQRGYGQSFARFPLGLGGDPTPDLPERGRDWHGTVPGVPDEPQGDGEQEKDEEAFKDPENLLDKKEGKKGPPEPVNLMAPTQEIQDRTEAQSQQQPAAPPVAAKSFHDLAMKSLAGAPRFSTGPFTPPRERSFLIEQGFTPEDVDSGAVNMTPRMRAQFNKDLLSAVQKAVTRLSTKIEES